MSQAVKTSGDWMSLFLGPRSGEGSSYSRTGAGSTYPRTSGESTYSRTGADSNYSRTGTDSTYSRTGADSRISTENTYSRYKNYSRLQETYIADQGIEEQKKVFSYHVDKKNMN